jgi:hypothetical protein
MKTLLKYFRTGTLLLLLLAGATTYAQQNGDNQSAKERIEALRIAFISQQLNLSPAEAEKFWPVYNAYRAEIEALQKNYPGQTSADQQLELEQKKLDLKRKYKPMFEAALGTEKLNQLFNLEHKFQEKLKEIREQRMQQRGAQGRQVR